MLSWMHITRPLISSSVCYWIMSYIFHLLNASIYLQTMLHWVHTTVTSAATTQLQNLKTAPQDPSSERDPRRQSVKVGRLPSSKWWLLFTLFSPSVWQLGRHLSFALSLHFFMSKYLWWPKKLFRGCLLNQLHLQQQSEFGVSHAIVSRKQWPMLMPDSRHFQLIYTGIVNHFHALLCDFSAKMQYSWGHTQTQNYCILLYIIIQ